MFPKHPKRRLAAEARQLERELRAAAVLPSTEREAKQHELGEQLETLMVSIADGAGLRLDGTLSHLPSGEQVWYDTTTAHTACSTKLTAELALTRKRRLAGKEGKDMQSAGLLTVHQNKLDRYALLAALVERQVLQGLRTAAPSILPVAVSSHGEFCPGAVRLQEWLVGKYRARLRLEGDRDDGEKLESLTADFRREFRSSLLVASCKGLADMLLAAGMPFVSKRAHRGSSAGGGYATVARGSSPPSPPSPPGSPHLGVARHDGDSAQPSDGEDTTDPDDDVGTVSGEPPRRSARLQGLALAQGAAFSNDDMTEHVPR